MFSPIIGFNGLLHATGRTKKLEVPTFDMKHPIFLHSRHTLLHLYLQHLHNGHCHEGVEYLRVCQKNAIVKFRTTLRSIHSKCVTCRKCKVESLNPMTAGLPKVRLVYGYSR